MTTEQHKGQRDRRRKRPSSKRPRTKAEEERAREEVSAGGIVYKRTPQGVRIAFILDPFGKWAFAKGHVEEGETIEAAAVRETREEMGLDDVRIVRPLGKIDFWFRDRYRPATRGALVHKYVHYFLMEAPSDAKGKPQKQEKIRRVSWVPIDKMLRRSSYKDVRDILRSVKRHFGQGKPRGGTAAGKRTGEGNGGATRGRPRKRKDQGAKNG